jgi:hypothetical protein
VIRRRTVRAWWFELDESTGEVQRVRKAKDPAITIAYGDVAVDRDSSRLHALWVPKTECVDRPSSIAPLAIVRYGIECYKWCPLLQLKAMVRRYAGYRYTEINFLLVPSRARAFQTDQRDPGQYPEVVSVGDLRDNAVLRDEATTLAVIDTKGHGCDTCRFSWYAAISSVSARGLL